LFLRQHARGSQEERLQSRLAVGAVGAEIPEIPSRLARLGKIKVRIDRAIKRGRSAGGVLQLEQIKRRSAGKGEIEIVARDQIAREVVTVVALETRERDRRVDVVE